MSLTESMIQDRSPFDIFNEWNNDAYNADIYEPAAMTVATVGEDGRPSARMVLLRGVDEHSFVFYTNYHSRKGKELEHCPWASAVVYWDRLHRQVRIEGPVEKTKTQLSDDYFASRPRGSQISAVASVQSAVIVDRLVLEAEVTRLESEFGEKAVPRPDFWGGYRIKPERIEFWQGQEDRLHDRIVFEPYGENLWKHYRLSP